MWRRKVYTVGLVLFFYDGLISECLAALSRSHLISLFSIKQMQVFRINIVILQINLVMILLRTNLTRFFHFTKPALSTLSSFKDIENIMQKRLVSAIKSANTHTLKNYSLIEAIKEKLAVEPAPAKQIAERTVNVSIINPRSLEHRIVEVPLKDGLSKVNLVPEEFGFPFRKAEDILVHFSEHRGAPNIEELAEYNLDDRTLLIFNLPENITSQDIQVTIRETTSKISIKYCVLGLPAYARVEFESAEDLNKILGKLENKKIEFGDRVAKIKTYKDAERLKLANRRMVIEIDENAKLETMVVDLSRFGRVLHIDWPIEAYMNPTVQDVKEFYQNSRELIKINKYQTDGSIESEYYPNLEIWGKHEDQRQYSNIVDKLESLKEAYENRSRFAKNINVYAGKEHQIILRNKGYCVVTYTTSEECQNLYFTEGGNAKMQLVGNKEQFQYDPLFKKELLRQIDNQYLTGKKNDFGRKEAAKKKLRPDQTVEPNKQNYYSEEEIPEDYESYYLLEKIIMHRYKQEAMTKSSNYLPMYKQLEVNNQFLLWEEHLRIMREAKFNKKTKTFDELAELELYGRVLPKDQNIQRLKVESIKYKSSREYELIKQNNLLTSESEYNAKKKFYERQKIRNNRIADENLGIDLKAQYERLLAERAAEQGETVETTESVADEAANTDGENIGKQHFSTTRPRFLYRKRNPQEIANYLRRYNQFLRTNIYEYMGVFQDKLVQEAVVGQAEVLNPQSLKFLDGTSFLTEPELLEALQFRRDFSKAQQDYDNYVYGNEFIKSSGLNLHAYYANVKENRLEAIQHLIDVGIVEETRRVEGKEEELKAKVRILNNEAANFGEEYRIEKHDDSNYLVKIRKLEPLLPLDRISHLESVVQEIDSSISREEATIFQKYYKLMKETGVIPDEVRKAFKIDNQISVAELMSEMGIVYNISKKDLEMTERLRSYSKEEINEDIDNQLKIQRQRKNKRKINSSDFAKDPSQIYVKDREGYFKVSRYRQI